MINLSEIFLSLQGESTYTGMPCIFIRLSGCNLRCSYCDTLYSHKTGFSMEKEEIVTHIEQYAPVKLVMITGGEPLLQEEVYLLFDLLKAENYLILLETNGSILLDRVPDYVVKIVDIKCPGSSYVSSFNKDNLKLLNDKDEIKFVLSGMEDYQFAKSFIASHLNNITNTILFSPVKGKLNLKALAEKILEDKLPVRLQTQLHKIIWGDDAHGV